MTRHMKRGYKQNRMRNIWKTIKQFYEMKNLFTILEIHPPWMLWKWCGVRIASTSGIIPVIVK